MKSSSSALTTITIALAVPFVVACGAGPNPTAPYDGPAVSIRVAALELTAVRNACYTITVTNQQGDPVWSASQLCADQYGDGVGGLAYVGPCDASKSGLPEGDTVNDNTVTLVLDDLYSGDAPTLANTIDRGSWVNPCGVVGGHWDGFGPCRRSVGCVANADVAVAFDLTILRDAAQGFFDVAVDFDDIFCSAKLDCIGAPGLVFDPDSGERTDSVVLGFACTSGTGPTGAPQPTWLYLSQVVVTCDGLAPMALDLASVTEDGNQGPVGAAIVQWMHMTGDEALGVGAAGGDFDKCYWNIAAGLDLAALAGRTCTLSATGSAASAAWPGLVPPADEVRPVITWSVPIWQNGQLCAPQPLDGPTSGVRTGYVGDAVSAAATSTTPFVRSRRCGPEPVVSSVVCAEASDTTFAPTTLVLEGEAVPAVEVRVGDDVGVFALPADDTYMIEGCCLGSCCSDR